MEYRIPQLHGKYSVHSTEIRITQVRGTKLYNTGTEIQDRKIQTTNKIRKQIYNDTGLQ